MSWAFDIHSLIHPIFTQPYETELLEIIIIIIIIIIVCVCVQKSVFRELVPSFPYVGAGIKRSIFTRWAIALLNIAFLSSFYRAEMEA